MFVQIIELRQKSDAPVPNGKTLANRFLYSLENNGQILTQQICVEKEHGYDLIVTTPKRDSLESRYDSIHAKRDRELLEEHFSICVREVGRSAFGLEYCECTARRAMEMQTFEGDEDSAFTCCSCGNPIALYELPYLNMQDDHWAIVNWQNSFRATDTLWLNSLSDRFTGNQLVKPTSALNRHGREIAEEISAKTKTKVYYNIFDDLTKKVEFTEVNGKFLRVCPSCGKTMAYIKFCDDYERSVCDECGLSSEIPKDY